MKRMYNPEIHHRRSIRLKEYDYSRQGAYFVTVCVKNKENSLGKIIDGEVVLSEIGKIAEKCWNEIPTHYPCVQLDKYVIMPNHIHGVIKIIDGDDNIAGVENVGAEDFQPLRSLQQLQCGLDFPCQTAIAMDCLLCIHVCGLIRFRFVQCVRGNCAEM